MFGIDLFDREYHGFLIRIFSDRITCPESSAYGLKIRGTIEASVDLYIVRQSEYFNKISSLLMLRHNMNQLTGRADIALIVFDSLRYDVAVDEFSGGRLKNLADAFLQGWEKRHSPGSFTFPAHQAFFAGFLPTPADSAVSRVRLFATEFAGSESTGEGTRVFPESDIVTGLRGAGYHTACIGGVGFFNRQTSLSCVLPDYFDESHWSPATGVTDPASMENQVELAGEVICRVPEGKRLFFFLNISAIHQPNCFYIPGKEEDDLETHAAALRYVDSCLADLFTHFRSRGPTFVIATSDHGTLYGEEGFTGHRVGHESVFTVPYLEGMLE